MLPTKRFMKCWATQLMVGSIAHGVSKFGGYRTKPYALGPQ